MIAAAIELLIPDLRHLTAIWLNLFFILILPANVHAALHIADQAVVLRVHDH